jgi:hypothetical protein
MADEARHFPRNKTRRRNSLPDKTLRREAGSMSIHLLTTLVFCDMLATPSDTAIRFLRGPRWQ